MNQKLQARLFRRYPKLFRVSLKRLSDIHNADEQTPGTLPVDVRGVECGDGWFAIVDRLSAACEQEISTLSSAGVAEAQWPRIAQIKEKFGSLRFYVMGPLSCQLRQQIADAQGDASESSRTCEQCGVPGRFRAGGSSQTRCDDCEKETTPSEKHPQTTNPQLRCFT